MLHTKILVIHPNSCKKYHLSVHTSSLTVSSVCFLSPGILLLCQSKKGKGQLHNWWKMTLCQLYNHPASPLLSLSPCRNSHIRRPLSCLFNTLPTNSLNSNGPRTLEERRFKARLLLSRWGSVAIDRWIPSGWKVGVGQSGGG